ncbi:OB-fold domain-containing protein [Orrella sp. JC864]|uniref:Zn-ribbon domain-containing OB-fold protein n=1 Tax=Orrella sp. JC864 TaxID=3120298 RepID=UPI00300B2A49
MNQTGTFPSPVGGLLEDRMWRGIDDGRMALPFCQACARAVYPPSGCCPHCLRTELPWRPLSGMGRIVSWTRFHRTYLPEYPAPYTVVAVALAEGPVMVSRLLGPEPANDEWIGLAVRMCYAQFDKGRKLPCFRLAAET